MYMKKILPFLFSLITLCSLHLAAFPLNAIEKDWTFDPKTSTLIPKYLAKVKVINGKAVIGDRELKKGAKIYNEELIQTSPKSFVVLEMIDLTVITLGPETDFKVQNWAYRTKNDREAVYNVLKGQWRGLIKSKSKDEDQLKIKTSLISMGVRGTELMVNVQNQAGKEINQVAMLSGHVRLEGELLQNAKKDLIAGDYEIIEKSEKGVQQQAKILSPSEMKSYQDYIIPEVHRLLDHVAINESASAKTNSEDLKFQDDQKKTQSNKSISPKSLEENLKLLNTTREQNLKSQ